MSEEPRVVITPVPPITFEIAAHVLWHFSKGGFEPGSFTVTLMELIARADQPNRFRLALGFPAYVAAVEAAMYTNEGISDLQAIFAAGIEAARGAGS